MVQWSSDNFALMLWQRIRISCYIFIKQLAVFWFFVDALQNPFQRPVIYKTIHALPNRIRISNIRKISGDKNSAVLRRNNPFSYFAHIALCHRSPPPYITVEIIYEHRSFYGLRFANHSKRLANHVRIKFDQSCLDSLNEPSYIERLQQAEDKECIIGVGQHYDLYFGSNKARENPNIILSGQITYYDANHPYTEPFGIDFSSYATFYSVNSLADDLLNEMKKQTKALQDINANLQLLAKTKQAIPDAVPDKSE